MDHAELRRRLKPILEAEERGEWDEVERLSDELTRDLMEQNSKVAPEIVDHYLDDADIRAQDHQYGETQRRELGRFIDTGEHDDGTVVPLWSCGLVVTLGLAALIWLLK